MSDRTSISVYLNGTPVDVSIYPYPSLRGGANTFFYKTIQISAALDGNTDTRKIRRWCHLNRGYSPEEADAYSLKKYRPSDMLELERICDEHYIVDLSSRCVYSPSFPDYENPSCLPLETLKTMPTVKFSSLQNWGSGVLWFDSINLEYVRQELVDQPWNIPDDFDYYSSSNDIRALIGESVFEEGSRNVIDLEDLLPPDVN